MTRCIVAACLLGLASPSGGAAAAQRDCAPRAARVVLVSGAVEVYRLRGRTSACHRVTRRRRGLGDVPSSSGQTSISVGTFRVRGDMLAYVITQTRDERELGIRVVDVRRGRLLEDVDALSGLGRPDLSARSAVTDLAVTARGVPAWIARNPYTTPETHEVATAAGEQRRQLDAGPGVVPRSLALSDGATLYWTSGGETRTAQLG